MFLEGQPTTARTGVITPHAATSIPGCSSRSRNASPALLQIARAKRVCPRYPSNNQRAHLTSKPGGKSMDLPKTTAFVPAANRGLRKHLTDQLISRGARVHGEAREPGTLDTGTGVIPVQLGITDPASVTAAALRVHNRRVAAAPMCWTQNSY
jgi:hypothetical protein